MTTQTPRWDLGPDETATEASAHPPDDPTPTERSAFTQVDWRLVAAIVGGVVALACGAERIPADWLSAREPLQYVT